MGEIDVADMELAESIVDAAPLRFTTLNPAQIRCFRAMTVPGVRMVICPMPNGIGKTYALAAIMGSIIWPVQAPKEVRDIPLFRAWPYRKDLRIISTAIAVSDGGAIQQAIRDVWPRERYDMSRGSGKGFYSQIRTDTGYTVDILTYNQDPQEHAGGTKGAIFASEPGPRRVISENLSRLRAGGIFYWEMTPLNYASYAKDDYIDKGGLFDDKGNLVGRIEVVSGDIEENCADHAIGGQLKHGEIAATIASWPVEEREARRTGGFMHLAGRIYTKFGQQNGNVLGKMTEYQQECWDKGLFNLVNTMDPHDRKPFAIGWHAIFPNDDVLTVAEYPEVLFHELSSSGDTVEDYRRIILATEAAMGKVADWRLMDPNFGNSKKLGEETIKERLAAACPECKASSRDMECEHKLFYLDPPDSIPDGHLAVRKAIGNSSEGVRPKYMVLADCRNHVYGMEHYGYKEELRPEERGPSEAPQLVHKDFPDNVRYLFLYGAHYQAPGAPLRTWKPTIRGGKRHAT